MKANLGGIDQGLRIVTGLAISGLAVAGIGVPWTWIGLVPLVTGLAGWCPAYALFGVRTCPLRRSAVKR